MEAREARVGNSPGEYGAEDQSEGRNAADDSENSEGAKQPVQRESEREGEGEGERGREDDREKGKEGVVFR